MKFSILTATFNRSNYLEKLYESIVNNISDKYEIEWLIMDDGSTDDTELVCSKFSDTNGLKVRYYKQSNQGKMQAINSLEKYVTGEIWIECDSDDCLVNNSLEYIYIKSKILLQNENLYALIFLKKEDNTISGNRFIEENKDTTMFDLYFKQDIKGEKIIAFNSKIRKKFVYIVEKEEKFCTEARLYYKMDESYKVRCYNKCIIEGVYHGDGYTKNIDKVFKNNPMGFYEYFKEILGRDMRGVTIQKRLYAIKHYILFSVITKHKFNTKYIRNNFNKMIYFFIYIPGKIKSKIWINKHENKR
ncbi:MAG: glycosyltransferase family 2 protein [Clostridia bacterium]|nr:glycosyltransferase family 2 protein [Clostridia bacterium]